MGKVYKVETDEWSYIGKTDNLERRMKEHRREWGINLFGSLAQGLMKVLTLFESDKQKRVDCVEKAEIYKALSNGENLKNKRI